MFIKTCLCLKIDIIITIDFYLKKVEINTNIDNILNIKSAIKVKIIAYLVPNLQIYTNLKNKIFLKKALASVQTTKKS